MWNPSKKKENRLSRAVNSHSFESFLLKVPTPQSSSQWAGWARTQMPLMHAISVLLERCNIALALSKIYRSFHGNTFQTRVTAWHHSSSRQHKFWIATSSCIDKIKKKNLTSFTAFDQDVYIFNHKSCSLQERRWQGPQIWSFDRALYINLRFVVES